MDAWCMRAGDALKADLSGAAMIYITSCMWDQPLVDAVHQKIATEAPADALIVANDFLEVGGRCVGGWCVGGWCVVQCGGLVQCRGLVLPC